MQDKENKEEMEEIIDEKTVKGKRVWCVITGDGHYLNKTYFANKVKKFGDEDTLSRVYVCNKAKKLLEKGYDVIEIRKVLGHDKEHAAEIDDALFDEILLLNGINTNKSKIDISSFTYNETDPEVKAFIENITNEQ